MLLSTIERNIERLSPADREEMARRIRLAELRARAGPLTQLELMVSTKCSMRCDYCWLDKRDGRNMPLAVAKKALDLLLASAGDSKQLTVVLFGGEPLLNFGMIRRFIPYAESRAAAMEREIGWSLTTNGLHLSKDAILLARDHGFNLLLSIDGQPGTHDAHRRTASGQPTFPAVMRGLDLLQRYQGWTGARMTVTPASCRSLPENFRFLVGLGINQFIIGPDNDARWRRADLDAYSQSWREVTRIYHSEKAGGRALRMNAVEQREEKDLEHVWGCGAGTASICVDPAGNLYPCSRFLGHGACEQAFWLGTLQDGFRNLGALHDLLDRRVTIRHGCMRCRYRSRCSGGCPATNYRHRGSIYWANALDCRLAREFASIGDDALPRAVHLPRVAFEDTAIPYIDLGLREEET